MGIAEGQYLTIRGQGHAGKNSGANGDLMAIIKEKSHEYFTRENEDLYLTYPIPFSIMALGDKIDVPTLSEKVKLKIPAGTTSEKLFRLKGKGLPILNRSSHGDLFVRVRVDVPTKLSDKEKKLIEELHHLNSTKVKKKSFFDKVF